MNRRALSLLLAGLILVPTSLMSAPSQKKPERPKCSCKECKKCDCKRGCKCKRKCKLECKCKPKSSRRKTEEARDCRCDSGCACNEDGPCSCGAIFNPGRFPFRGEDK